MSSSASTSTRHICVKDGEEEQELETTDHKITLFYIQQYFAGCVGLAYTVEKQNMSGKISRACKIDKGGILHVPEGVYELKVIYPSEYIF